MFSEKEAQEATLAYFNGDDLAASVWLSKYALRDNTGVLLEKTPEDMHHRLAREFARIEGKYPNPMSEDEIYELLKDWTVVPQGSPMAGVGNPYQLQSLSNCFVIESCKDSFGSILKTDEEQCQIMKRRGGVGHDISNIRPKGMPTNNAAKTTDGISVFMERFSSSCRSTAQGGRRGALMLLIACNHMEVETFIDIKRDRTKVTGANISIKLTDAFMHAVESDKDFVLQWPVDVPIDEAKVTKTVKARDLWHKIISAAHECAEPGLMFWDNVTKYGPADAYPLFRSIATNPCSELPLPAYESCRLLLINVNKFICDRFKETALFDFNALAQTAQKAQRLMDDLIDLELECIDKIIHKIKNDPEDDDIKRNELELWKKIKKMCLQARRTGLGVTGLGDAIAGLNLKYGSDASISLTENIYKCMTLNAYASSITMAKERGPFPGWDPKLEEDHPFLERVLTTPLQDGKKLNLEHSIAGRRNIALTTTAPAGSVSILTQTTSGIEPVFMLSYLRRKKINNNDANTRVDFIDALGDKWEHFTVYHHGYKQWLNAHDNEANSPYEGATSADVSWEQRVKLQAAAQKWVCHGISSTINLPKETSVEVVKDIYMSAWKQGLKGITVYRDGCRDGVLVTEDTNKLNEFKEVDAPKRPKILECDIHRVAVKGESYVVFVGLLNGKPYELFAGSQNKIELPKKCSKGSIIKNGKKDGISTYDIKIPIADDFLVFKDVVNLFDNNLYGAFTRLVSLALRHGVAPKFVAEQIKKDKHSDMTSFSNVLARVLSKSYIQDGARVHAEKECTQCSSTNLVYQSGCVQCADCGYSKC